MKLDYYQSRLKRTFQSKTDSPALHFAKKVFLVLVENSKETFFVGGVVRDALLGRSLTDFDLATKLLPSEVMQTFRAEAILFDNSFARFGVVTAKVRGCTAEIATFRKDRYGASRYPTISFTEKPHTDSLRRDFTINALYFSLKTGDILDFHQGLKDLEERKIRFIGDPKKRIQEDPLRIVRAVRFAITLKDFTLDPATQRSIQKYFSLLRTVSASRLKTEFAKINATRDRQRLEKIINNKFLDKKIFFAL